MGRAARANAERRDRVINAYVEAAREILPKVFSPDCCLNGTRVCIEALASHGVNARPMVVDMMVSNETAMRMFNEHDGWPTSEADVQRWMTEGAWVVHVDGKGVDGMPGWASHMIADVGEYLVDSSLGQASRPAKGIETPWVAAFPRGGLGITGECILYDLPKGATVGFRHRPDVTSYNGISGFMRSSHNMEIARGVADRMRELLYDLLPPVDPTLWRLP